MPGRVRTRRQFAQLTNPTKRGRSGPLRISLVEGAPEDREVSVAYAISRKVGNAVERNRIRRRLRALIDAESSRLPAGIYLIKCGLETGKCTYDQLQHHLNEALRSFE